MDSLGIKEFERDFPLGDGVDLLDFELGGDEIGGDTKKSDFFKGSSSDYSSGSGGGGGGGGGGGLFGPAEQEEELEWLTEFPDVPDVGFNILDDVKPGFIDIRFPGQQHSPVSVLENNNSGGSTDKKTTTTKTTTTPFVGSITPLKVPSGFPVFVRKKRVFRKRRLGGFGQEHYKHLFLAGVSAAHEQQLDAIRSSSVKIVRKNRGAATGGRRCLHCGSDKTPQWRTGPSGKKTLCNACGVRYKSGRLVPEYRPANSPTFTPVLHSNSHRKIMEMRRKKEDGGGIGQMMMINGTF